MRHRSARQRREDERTFLRIYLSVLGSTFAGFGIFGLAASRGDQTLPTWGWLFLGAMVAAGVYVVGVALVGSERAIDRWGGVDGGHWAAIPLVLIAGVIYWFRKRTRR